MNTRKYAVEIITDWEKNRSYINKVVNDRIDNNPDISSLDKAFLRRTVLGTVERKIELDSHIAYLTKNKKQKPFIRALLETGIYQILYMDDTADFATVNEMVNIVKKSGYSSLKGFINAVLRRTSREKDSLKNFEYIKKKDISGIKYSMPDELVKIYREAYGKEKSEEIFSWFLKVPPLYIRCNESKTSREKLVEYLNENNITFRESALIPYVFAVEGFPKEVRYLIDRGLVNVQDLSSALTGTLYRPSGKEKVLDICAAPGGKSLHMADRLALTGEKDWSITACDIHDSSIGILKENIEKSGFSNITVLKRDGEVFVPEDEGKYDLIIADLPCSGLGVISRKPDIKYYTTLKDIEEIAKIQRKILNNAVKYLKNGGVLIYSTCTNTERENREQLKYLKEELHMETEDLNPYLPKVLQEENKKEFLEILPGFFESDGFFMARLVKNYE